MRFRLLVLLLITAIPAVYGQSQPDTNGFTNKHEATNQTVNDHKDGKWVEYFDKSFSPTNDTNAPYYTLTTYFANQIIGMQRWFYKSGALYIVLRYGNGQKNGTQKTYYENGTLKREKNYKNDLENGVQKFYYTTGKLKREITYLNDSAIKEKDYGMDGKELDYANGFKDITEAKNVMIDSVADGKWVISMDNNFHKTNDADAPYYVLACYNYGELAGIVRWYYKSGDTYKEIPYFNGMANGIQKTYYEDGKIKREKPLKNNYEVGVEKLYYESGKLECETTFKNGKIWSKKNFDENGNELH